MKVAEFFADLGFRVDGEEALDQSDRSLVRVAFNAAAAALAVKKLNEWFWRLVAGANAAGIELRQFSDQTGLSAQRLQQWQKAGSGMNVQAREMAESIKAIQQAGDAAAFEGVATPWLALGIDPRQNPFDVLEQMHQRLRELPESSGRFLAQQAGFSESMYQFLKQADLKLGEFNKKLAVSTAEQGRLNQYNAQWQSLQFTLSALATKFGSVLAPVLTRCLGLLEGMLTVLISIVDWMGGEGIFPTIARTGVAAFTVAIVAAATAIGTLVAVGQLWKGLGPIIVRTITGIASALPYLMPMLRTLPWVLRGILGLVWDSIGGIAKLGGRVFWVVGVLWTLISTIRSFWQSLDEGTNEDKFPMLTRGMETIQRFVQVWTSAWDIVVRTVRNAMGIMKADMQDALPDWVLDMLGIGTQKDMSARIERKALRDDAAGLAASAPMDIGRMVGWLFATPAMAHLESLMSNLERSGMMGRSTSNSTQTTNNVDIVVDGATDPRATGRAVAEIWGRELGVTESNTPVYAY